MKNIIIAGLLFLGLGLFAQDHKKTTASFHVSGNCEMCQKTIEESLLVKGVKSASWNMSTQILTVVYHADKINLEKIHDLVAKSGYDTDTQKADEAAYLALPKCCKYTRKF